MPCHLYFLLVFCLLPLAISIPSHFKLILYSLNAQSQLGVSATYTYRIYLFLLGSMYSAILTKSIFSILFVYKSFSF